MTDVSFKVTQAEAKLIQQIVSRYADHAIQDHKRRKA